MKLYTSKKVLGFLKEQGKTLQVFWDDCEFWTHRRPTDSQLAPALKNASRHAQMEHSHR